MRIFIKTRMKILGTLLGALLGTNVKLLRVVAVLESTLDVGLTDGGSDALFEVAQLDCSVYARCRGNTSIYQPHREAKTRG